VKLAPAGDTVLSRKVAKRLSSPAPPAPFAEEVVAAAKLTRSC
jgi:hypothetical protein